jgi:type IV secretory pathway VirB4 component
VTGAPRAGWIIDKWTVRDNDGKIETMALKKDEFGNSLDLVNIKEIRDNTVIMKDGGLRQIIMVGGVNFALKSETEQGILTQGYQNFLNGIDFPLQIIVHSRKVNIDKYVDELLARKEIEESPLLQSQIDEYVEFVKGFVQKNAIMEKTFLIVVPFYPAGLLPTKKTAMRFMPFLNKKQNKVQEAKDTEEAERIFRENLAQLTQRVSQVSNGLFGMGLEVTVLSDEALIELFYNFYNPQTVERRGMSLPKEQHA